VYVVVNGGGKVGSHLTSVLIRSGHDVAIMEKRPDVVARLVSELSPKTLIICGDGCDDGVQRDAGVARADIFAAVTGVDSDNLVSCRVARVAFGARRTVARVNNPKNERIFNKLGIEAMSSTTIISRLIEEEIGVGDIHTLATLRRGDLAIVEILLPKDDDAVVGKSVVGKTVAELWLPVDCVLVALVRGEEVILIRGSTRVFAGDSVIAFTKVDQEQALKTALTGR
jgi:trk system potassium uptake protein TrkA